MELVHSSPNVFYVRNFLTEGDIAHLNNILTENAKKFKNSFTEDDSNKRVVSQERTSTFIFLRKSQDRVVRGIESRAADLVSMASEFVEPLQLVSYTDGQEFQLHHDAGTLLDDGSVETVPPLRYVTIFVYLNTLPEGQGHTEFPLLGLSVKPERGACVMWSNVLPDGRADPRTVHKANPIRGDLHKVGMNVWIGQESMQHLALAAPGKQKRAAAAGPDSSKRQKREKGFLQAVEAKTQSFLGSGAGSSTGGGRAASAKAPKQAKSNNAKQGDEIK